MNLTKIKAAAKSPIPYVFSACLTYLLYSEWNPVPLTSKTGLVYSFIIFFFLSSATIVLTSFFVTRRNKLTILQHFLTIFLSVSLVSILFFTNLEKLPEYIHFLPKGAVEVNTITGDPVEIFYFNTGTTDSINTYKTKDGLRWSGKVDQEIVLQFKTGPQFGIVEVINNNEFQNVERLQLTAEREDLLTIRFAYPTLAINRIVTAIVLWTTCCISFYFLTLFFVTYNSDTIIPRRRSKYWYLFALPMILVWTFFLLTLYPGMYTPDSLDQLAQAKSGVYTDWHPVFHTLLIRLVLVLHLPPSAFLFAQITILSIVIVYGLDLLYRCGMSKIVYVGLYFLFTFAPTNIFFPITLWKDIPYAISLFSMFVIMTEVFLSNGTSFQSNKQVFFLTTCAVGTALFRHNGLPVAILLLIMLILCFQVNRKKFLTVFLISLLIIYFMIIPVQKILAVNKTTSKVSNGILLQILSAHISNGSSLSHDEVQMIDSFLPVKEWSYNPCYAGKIIFNNSINWDNVNDFKKKVIYTIFSLTIKNPLVTINHLIDSSNLVWKVLPGQCARERAYFDKLTNGTYKWTFFNDFEEVQNSWFPNVIPFIYNILSASSRNAIFWNPPLLSYITIWATCILAIKCKRKSILAIASPTLLQSAVMFFVFVAQNVRYQYSVILIGILSIGLLFIKKPSSLEREPQPDA